MSDKIVSIGLPEIMSGGQQTAIPESEQNTGKSAEEVTYKFPPVVWMFVFLIAGYVGVRFILED